MPASKIPLDRKTIQGLYLQKGWSTRKIGVLLGCSWATIRNRIIEFGIPVKNPSWARMKYPKYDFSRDGLLKAYMIGFRIGDLNVYTTAQNTETVIVRCHTTQEEQINVIQGLFNKFGKVTISKNKQHYHINCFLNKTFDFLLPKDNAWMVISPKHFAAFVAGYTDAEGNFIINQGRARFKIDSYDRKVLEVIANWLQTREIQFKLRQIACQGDIQYIRGIKAKYNGDLWRLNINQAGSLKKFIIELLPLLRHQKRIQDAQLSLRNIISRE